MKSVILVLALAVLSALAALGVLLIYVCLQGDPLPLVVRAMLVGCALLGGMLGAFAGFFCWAAVRSKPITQGEY